MEHQQTIRYPVSITGVGLQSGDPVTLKISPAGVNTGISFFPASGKRFQPIYSGSTNITRCDLSTDIGNEYDTVSTIEHLLSALHALRIDNVNITLSGGNEIPILDGSARPFYHLLLSGCLNIQDKPRRYTQVARSVIIKDKKKWIKIDPCDDLIIDCTIKFDHPAIGEQNIIWKMHEDDYYWDISMARTFGFKDNLIKLREMGYLKGGDDQTAIILGKKKVVNGALRCKEEFVRHKLLDLIGDIYVGGPIKGYITSYCSGHALNNRLMRKINEQTDR